MHVTTTRPLRGVYRLRTFAVVSAAFSRFCARLSFRESDGCFLSFLAMWLTSFQPAGEPATIAKTHRKSSPASGRAEEPSRGAVRGETPASADPSAGPGTPLVDLHRTGVAAPGRLRLFEQQNLSGACG